MSWWTSVLGGALGYMIGGPLGAMLGVAFAGNLSKGKSNFRGSASDYRPGDQQRVQAAFFSSVFSVMGYIAKVDGKVSKSEILLAQQVMQHMQLSEDMQKAAKELFNQGKQKYFNLDEVLEQFRTESHRRTHLVRMFLEIQIQATYADGVFDDKEYDALKYIAQKLRFPIHELERLIQQFSVASGKSSKLTIDDAYVILGADKSLTDKELKRAYRRLLAQHHPDKLVAKGLPDEMIN